MKAPTSFSDIINLWPSAGEMATDVGATSGVVRLWRHRDSIPAPFWAAVVTKAKAKGYRGVTAELLTSLAASKKAA